MDYRLEVLTLAVTDVDRAAAFYAENVGFVLDVDYHPTSDFRVVQLTPPGSACSIQIGVGLTEVPTRIRTSDLPGCHRHRNPPTIPDRARRQR